MFLNFDIDKIDMPEEDKKEATKIINDIGKC